MNSLRKHWIPYLASFVVGFYNIHGLFLPKGYIPVEINDEPSHTFVDIGLFIKYLKQGELYIINLFNNFGTPVVGDAVAVPWAPHSLFYFLYDPLTAMMLIKVTFGFLGMIVLYHLSLMFQSSRMIAFWTAFLCYSNPAFLWFIQHHPHQGVLFFFALSILCLERLFRDRSWQNYSFYFFSILLLLAGSGVNGAFLACMFIALYSLINLPRIGFGGLVKVAALSVCAAGILFPHYFAFYEWTPLSARSGFKLFDLPRVKAFYFGALIKNLYWFRAQTTIHMDWAVHQTGIYITFIPYLIFHWYRFARTDKGPLKYLGRSFILLGVVVSGLVYLLLARLDILDKIPLFKSSDVTRLLWFSMIFVNIYLGAALLDVIKGRDRSWTLPLCILFQVFFSLYVYRIFIRNYPYEAEDGFLFVNVGIFFGYVFATVATFCLWAYTRVKFDGLEVSKLRIGRVLLVAGLFAILVPRMACFIYLNRAWRSSIDQFGFMPPQFMKVIEPRSRLAGLFDLTPEAPDQRAALHEVFGSGGRSIILSRDLRAFFAKRGLIADGYLTYNFLPTSPKVLSEFGIRYVMTREGQYDDDLNNLGWIKIATTEHFNTRYALFESPMKPSIVYCEDKDGEGRHFLTEFSLGASNIEVVVPPACNDKKLILTQYSWPGWHLQRDGVASPFGSHEVFLTAPDLKTGEKLRFYFWPRYLSVYPWVLCLSIILGALILVPIDSWRKVKWNRS